MDSPRTIGKYEILDRIGERGGSALYAARDPLIGRRVAIRVSTAADPEHRRRFLDGAQIAESLHHANIATVFESGEDADARAFLIQEDVPGRSLATELDGGGREGAGGADTAEALGYLVQLARGLDYAHRKGVAHRGLRPGAVRITEDGRIKIVGFGIARADGDASAADGYLAPEQLRGEEAGPRSDLFSFGVLARELLTGEHPFGDSADREGLLARIAEGPRRDLSEIWDPAGSGLDAEAAGDAAALLDRCLAEEPAERPEGFAEVASALDRALDPRRPDRTPGASRRSSAAPPAEDPDASPGTRSPGTSDLEATQLVDPVPPPPSASAAPSAEEAPADPTQRSEPPPSDPAPDRRATAGTRAALLAGIVLLSVLAVAAIWWIATSPEASPASVSETGAGGAAGGDQGNVVVQAVPWGRLERITDAEGRELPLPPESTTPMALRLPPGEHTLTLTHPEAPEPGTCTVDVAPGEVRRCRVELLRIDPARYFRESGWWR